MKIFPKIAFSLLFFATLFIACNKEPLMVNTTTSEVDLSLVEEITVDAPEDGDTASTRGTCGAFAVSVEYKDFSEYEFDINFGGYTSMHFASNKSGTTKIITNMPVAVQSRLVTLSNKPLAKQNPTCPWITGENKILIKVFQATKNAKGGWEPVKDTNVLKYTLGSTTPNSISKWGTRTYCLDKPIGSWYFCGLN